MRPAPPALPAGSHIQWWGLSDHASDLVARAGISLTSLDVSYRGRFDRDSLRSQRSELAATFGHTDLRTSVNYAFFDGSTGSGEFADREEISGVATAQITDYWSFQARHRRNLVGDGNSISTGFAFIYQDECFYVNLGFDRSFTVDRDLLPANTVYLRVVLKNLGESVQTRAF